MNYYHFEWHIYLLESTNSNFTNGESTVEER